MLQSRSWMSWLVSWPESTWSIFDSHRKIVLALFALGTRWYYMPRKRWSRSNVYLFFKVLQSTLQTGIQNINGWLQNVKHWPGYYGAYEITTQQTTATWTSDLSENFYVRGLENSRKVVDLLAQKLLNDMTLDWYSLMNSSLHTRIIDLFVYRVVRSFS